MIKFKVLWPKGKPTFQIVCKCGKSSTRTKMHHMDLRPFICWACLLPLPNVMSLYKYEAYRIAYCRSGTIPPLFSPRPN